MRVPSCAAVVLSAATTLPAFADSAGLFSDRAAFEAELRAAILANGDVIATALAGPQPVQSLMQEEIDKDLSLLDALAPELLAGHDIAFFTAPECADCAKAEDDLQSVSERYGVTFIRHDLSEPRAANWARSLGLDEAPFYVLPRMILRGAMPPVALEKYLSRAAGE